MRLFIAIGANDLSFDPEKVLKKLKVNLDKSGATYRWIPQTHYHITLNFLGETSEEKIPLLREVLRQETLATQPFDLKLDGIGAFPQERSGRVIWMGVQNSIQLRDLQSRCEERLKDFGFMPENKRYRPHLTLARLRSPKQLRDILSPVKNAELGVLHVRELTLFQSKLAGSFPVYIPLEQFPLGINIPVSDSV